jgi:hypothetical protein
LLIISIFNSFLHFAIFFALRVWVFVLANIFFFYL